MLMIHWLTLSTSRLPISMPPEVGLAWVVLAARATTNFILFVSFNLLAIDLIY